MQPPEGKGYYLDILDTIIRDVIWETERIPYKGYYLGCFTAVLTILLVGNCQDKARLAEMQVN